MNAGPYTTAVGHYIPAGAQAGPNGVNFSLFARDAAAVELRLFRDADSETALQVIRLDPERNRTFFFWHVYVQGLSAGVHYTWRVAGPGQRLDDMPELLDPYARAISNVRWQRAAAIAGAINGNAMRAIVIAHDKQIAPPRAVQAFEDAVIYEVHVGTFTRHSSACVRHPGTFSALVEKIPYLKA